MDGQQQFMPGEIAGMPQPGRNIAGGNAPLQSLMDLMTQQAQRRMASAPKPEERQAALDELKRAQQTTNDDRPDWKVLAEGYMAGPNLAVPGLNATAAFQHLLKTKATNRELQRRGAIAAAEAQYKDITEREQNLVPGLGTGAMTALVSDALNPRLTNVAGVGLIDQRSRQVVVPASEMANYKSLFEKFYTTAVEQKLPDPEGWAQQQAVYQLRTALGSTSIAGGRAEPLNAQLPAPTRSAAQPQTASVTFSPEVDAVMNALPPGGTGAYLTPGTDQSAILKQLEADEKKAVAAGDYQRATEVRKARQAIEAKGASTPAAPETKPSPLKYRDVPKAKMEEATADVTGKALGKENEDLQAASANSAMLKTQLVTLQQLFKTPNLPEGAMGEKLQGIRSSLASLGIEVGPEVAAGDMINAISGKLALLTRTAEGSNLMPGAMSDFEQKILRSLAPGLGQTAEGRIALAGYLSDLADVRIRLASEAQKMAKANRGILPPDWYERRDRVLLEEQARLAQKARALSAQFKGAK